MTTTPTPDLPEWFGVCLVCAHRFTPEEERNVKVRAAWCKGCPEPLPPPRPTEPPDEDRSPDA